MYPDSLAGKRGRARRFAGAAFKQSVSGQEMIVDGEMERMSAYAADRNTLCF